MENLATLEALQRWEKTHGKSGWNQGARGHGGAGKVT